MIRNELEHEDKAPPTRERILEFAELTWYFLKSTDNLVNYIVEEFNIVPTDKVIAKYYWLNIKGDLIPGNNIELHGWIKPIYISNKSLPNWIKLIEPELETRSQMIKKLNPNNLELKFDKEYGGRGKNANDLFLKAKLCLSDHIFWNICKLYFSSGI
ncbi:hypothetical protein [Geobacter sp. SVR]|uniref:hypothetical protein n=1 Tax=Geobacter sp. SVR TaxID=2495594 RepID=UPI00156795C6|nr:hypothetical protein [Geobacter sp. SVR]